MKNTNKPTQTTEVSSLLTDNGASHHAQISKIVDEHIQWLQQISKAALQKNNAPLATPKTRTFSSWYRKAMLELPEEQHTIDLLAVLHDQLHKSAAHALTKAAGQPLDLTHYENICAQFTHFIEPLRAFEKAFNAMAHGVDTQTGLRSRYGLQGDLAAEQKRMQQSGMPLTLVLASLDDSQHIETLHGRDTRDNACLVAAECILSTLRAYDSAYRVGTTLFLLCLKRANIAEAKDVIERLQEKLANNPVRLFGGSNLGITLSYTTAAVTPEDDIAMLIKQMQRALAV